MKKQKRYLLLSMILVLILSMCGCGFSVGSKKDETIMGKSFTQIFDREKPSGAYKYSMVKYDVTTKKFGSMVVVLDTSNGHTFEMDESGDFFTVYDKQGNAAVVTHFYEKESYARDTASMDQIEKINFRDFFTGKYDGGYYAMSYMADCGLDLGIFMSADDKDDFQLLAFGGEPIEGSSEDIHFYQGKNEPEPTPEPDVPDSVDPTEPDVPSNIENIIEFDNGHTFPLSTYVVADRQDHVFILDNAAGAVEAYSYEGTDMSTVTDLMRKAVEGGDTPPVVDYHSEGNYITGMYKQSLMCGFITADENGTVYTIILYSQNPDTVITVANSLVDDLLAADFLGGSVRTQYGEPVGGGENTSGSGNTATGKYYTVPAGFECTYSCDYFDSYSGDQGSITFNYTDENTNVYDFLNGGSDDDYGSVLSLLSTINTSYGRLYIVQTYDEEYDTRSYYAVTGDGSINVEFSVYAPYGEEVSKTDVENFIKMFIK